MTLYIKNLKDSTKELLDLINKFGKILIAGYKINTQKSVEFIYTNNKLSERETTETIPFTTATTKK